MQRYRNLCAVAIGGVFAGALALCAAEPAAVHESAREIPVAASADVVVVGGSSGGVAAAIFAARAGAKVFMLAPRTYLGEDMAGTMRLWLESGEKPNGGLPEAVFGKETFVTPGKLKQALEDALAAADVDFLYGCYVADILTDGQRKPCGVVMANRSGRQAILSKVIVDATENATVARLAGAQFTPFAPGPQSVRWVTVAAQPRSDAGQKTRRLPLPLEVSVASKGGGASKGRAAALDYAWWEYTLSLDLADGSWPARARLEQRVRDLAYHETQLYSADVPFLVPADAIVTEKADAGAWPGAATADLAAFRPAGVERLWVLGGCAGVPRAQVEALLRPLAFMEIGQRIGKAAAEQSKGLKPPQSARVVRAAVTGAAAGQTKEALAGIGASSKSVPQDQGSLPILGRYDVVVVGGGTAGAPAGIGAARQGTRTLVIEYLHGLGGVGTLGMIGGYFHGNKVGFTTQIPASPTEKRMEWYRRELRQAGADIWFGAIGCGALVEGRRVTGVVVATPHGRGVVLAKTVIDATGNSDIAISAGADYVYLDDPRDPDVVQNAHLPPRPIGVSYANGNLLPIDDANPAAATRFFRSGRKALSAKGVFDVGQIVDSRERRRIVGDYCLDWMDILNERTFPDTIEYAKSSYDSHGGPTHVYFRFGPIPGTPKLVWMGPGFWAYVPYRCLLPKGLEGILVTGLGMSAERNAMPIVRMQPDMHNQGYAAGVAAAMAVKAGVTPRQVDVKALQRHLVEVGNLAPEVLTHSDSYPLPAEKVKAAVATAGKDFQGIEVLLAQPEAALPLLRGACESEKGEAKIAYASILGLMGDATGVPTLLDVIKTAKAPASVQERVVAALGYARDRRAVPALLELLETKNARYAAAEALGRIGDPAAAAALAAALRKQETEDQKNAAKRKDPTPDRRAVKTQFIMVWALWRCGDKDDAAKTALKSFADGENSLYAHLARKLLRSPDKTSPASP
jgi:flavin-dependent dehydrogenase